MSSDKKKNVSLPVNHPKKPGGGSSKFRQVYFCVEGKPLRDVWELMVSQFPEGETMTSLQFSKICIFFSPSHHVRI